MKNISVDDIIFIHDLFLEKSGGLSGVRDHKLLDSAANKPNSHFFGFERYKSLHDKAASILEAIAVFHPFNDGNKRTAMAAAGYFLFLNGYDVTYTNEDYENYMVYVVNNKPPVSEISDWLKARTSPSNKS